MRKIKENEAQRRKQAESIRKKELEQMEEYHPSESAKWQMRHKPYPGKSKLTRKKKICYAVKAKKIGHVQSHVVFLFQNKTETHGFF